MRHRAARPCGDAARRDSSNARWTKRSSPVGHHAHGTQTSARVWAFDEPATSASRPSGPAIGDDTRARLWRHELRRALQARRQGGGRDRRRQRDRSSGRNRLHQKAPTSCGALDGVAGQRAPASRARRAESQRTVHGAISTFAVPRTGHRALRLALVDRGRDRRRDAARRRRSVPQPAACRRRAHRSILHRLLMSITQNLRLSVSSNTRQQEPARPRRVPPADASSAVHISSDVRMEPPPAAPDRVQRPAPCSHSAP